MTRLVLAAAQMLAEDTDGWGMPVLRALLPVAGMTVIEQQAERARAAGCERMLLLVDTVPAALTEACDRIRRRGLSLDLVRSPADVATALQHEDHMLLVADGLIAGESLWTLVGLNSTPVLLTAGDSSVTQQMERIDGHSRWVGLACVGPQQIAQLHDAPQDWDAQLLLLRHAVQSGVRREDCDAALFVTGAVALAESSQGAAEVEQHLLADEIRTEHGIASRWVISPFLQLSAPLLLRRQDSGQVMRSLTVLLGIGAGVAAFLGHAAIMAGVGLLAAISDQAARFIGRLRPETSLWQWVGRAGLWAQFIALTIAERGISQVSAIGSGASAIAILLLLSMLIERKEVTRPGSIPDFATLWPVAGIAVGVLGWRAGFDAAAIVIGGLLILALWLSRNDIFSKKSDDPV